MTPASSGGRNTGFCRGCRVSLAWACFQGGDRALEAKANFVEAAFLVLAPTAWRHQRQEQKDAPSYTGETSP